MCERERKRKRISRCLTPRITVHSHRKHLVALDPGPSPSPPSGRWHLLSANCTEVMDLISSRKRDLCGPPCLQTMSLTSLWASCLVKVCRDQTLSSQGYLPSWSHSSLMHFPFFKNYFLSILYLVYFHNFTVSSSHPLWISSSAFFISDLVVFICRRFLGGRLFCIFSLLVYWTYGIQLEYLFTALSVHANICVGSGFISVCCFFLPSLYFPDSLST